MENLFLDFGVFSPRQKVKLAVCAHQPQKQSYAKQLCPELYG